jgi:hypothetical protein
MQRESFMQIEGEEHSTELIKSFSLRDEHEMTATLEPTIEEEEYIIEFVEMYEELEAQERRINMKNRLIQQIKLEIGGGEYHPGEKLEEFGVEPTHEEIIEVNLSEEEAEQQLSGETIELESATECPTSAT